MFLESNRDLSHFLPLGTVKELERVPSSYTFFLQAQMEGLFSGSHNGWLTPVLQGWVTVAVSLGTLQRHHVISTAAAAKQAAAKQEPSQLHAFLHPCPWAGSRRSWCSLLLSHAALVLVIVGPVLFLMLHVWVRLVH